MKIAMPYNRGRINEHFGISQEFVIFNVEEGKIGEKKIISSSDLQHNHGGLANLFIREGVGVIIAGGMGPPMADALRSVGLEVITGASGDAEKVTSDYLSGQLVTSSIGCNHGCSEHDHL
ncbi:MAG: Dinitrogenase iron-molybdenum cofactor [Pelotomaculum sp. PtaB.Bin013]|uniref:NifB/NifX family molybdenum-iron cluster-binding protein n=1 Tax=Pelotomaculum isophthalicicum JI TaxID=947010 RepID=A0A9X4H5N6_9FIRM|nr:NifB/NifX family molybdenum-iron cluster-binding protein [Pelotomaculum isophthalicicum]MDF9409813.1 NifB/NifX family molybdenum-iron cluster-binding protein [Pelotomaculum isophthalicicum JI]OPX86028.1 MAG: Dinitrogenase iron-molybdenum cofactor [Pelotomaculum sp. PtaB.Bin013]